MARPSGWLCLALAGALSLSAQAAPPTSAGSPLKADAIDSVGIHGWLRRLHEASRQRSYVGTFVVTSASSMSSAKIWHVGQGDQQFERVEALTGPPRSVFRHNDQVLTLLPEQKRAFREKRESLGTFPDLFTAEGSQIADWYVATAGGAERVAGHEADLVQLTPKDNLRFTYRVWVAQKSGLVLKLQTLDADTGVLEQAAFSELQLKVPLKIDKLVQMMAKTEGYRVEAPVLLKTTASAQGWWLKKPVPGFRSVSGYRRPVAAGRASESTQPFQWTFSDGLASVSLFIEPYDGQRHVLESSMALGATHTLTRRLDQHWLTAMGEVPHATLKQFAASLERQPLDRPPLER